MPQPLHTKAQSIFFIRHLSLKYKYKDRAHEILAIRITQRAPKTTPKNHTPKSPETATGHKF